MSILGIAIQNMLAHENVLDGDTTPVKPHIKAWQKQISDRIAFNRFMLGLELQLTHTAVPNFARSGTTATFTRATTDTWKNNDGYLVTGVAGEIGFVGARRVRNLLTFTEDFSNAVWVKTNLTVTSNAAPAPNDEVTADLLTEGAGAIAPVVYWNSSTSITAGNRYVGAFSIKPNGRNIFAIYFQDLGFAASGRIGWVDLSNQTTQAQAGVTVAITAEANGFYRASISAVADATTSVSPTAIGILPVSALGSVAGYAGDGVSGFYLWGAQLEDVTAQTTQTAGEYVSVGVASSPYYHGSMVDGVKCFATDLSGNPIAASTMLGYSAEGARTNLCLQSNAFTTTWGGGGTTTTPTQNVVGPDGALSAWTLTDNDAGVTEFLFQTITLTASAYTYSVFVKKTTGAQASYPVIAALTGTTIALATIDTSNGIATSWTANTGRTILSGASASCVSFNANYWRVSLTYTATVAAYNHYLFPAATKVSNQSTGDFDVTATGSAVFYGAQVELGSFASSYIPTTTVAVTRNASVLTYSSAGNIDGTKGWCYAELGTNWASPGGQKNALGFSAGIDGLINHSSSIATGLRIYDSTNSVEKSSVATMQNSSVKYSGTWGGTTMSITGGGAAVATGAFDGSIGGTTIAIGCSGTGASNWDGTIRNVRIGQRALSASELQAVTAS